MNTRSESFDMPVLPFDGRSYEPGSSSFQGVPGALSAGHSLRTTRTTLLMATLNPTAQMDEWFGSVNNELSGTPMHPSGIVHGALGSGISNLGLWGLKVPSQGVVVPLWLQAWSWFTVSLIPATQVWKSLNCNFRSSAAPQHLETQSLSPMP